MALQLPGDTAWRPRCRYGPLTGAAVRFHGSFPSTRACATGVGEADNADRLAAAGSETARRCGTELQLPRSRESSVSRPSMRFRTNRSSARRRGIGNRVERVRARQDRSNNVVAPPATRGRKARGHGGFVMFTSLTVGGSVGGLSRSCSPISRRVDRGLEPSSGQCGKATTARGRARYLPRSAPRGLWPCHSAKRQDIK